MPETCPKCGAANLGAGSVCFTCGSIDNASGFMQSMTCRKKCLEADIASRDSLLAEAVGLLRDAVGFLQQIQSGAIDKTHTLVILSYFQAWHKANSAALARAVERNGSRCSGSQ